MDNTTAVVFTNKAHCRDCYRCLRVCPVKAIRMADGQAFVDPSRCIGCGTCIRECPQRAKQYRNDLDRAAALTAGGAPVAVSVAPSFAAVFSPWEQKRLPAALRRLGFSFVAETAVGAYPVAQETARLAHTREAVPLICSSCPAVVQFIRLYRPDAAAHLAPVASPMVAHAAHLRHRLGSAVRIVFIGPCVAKKAEADLPENAGCVDCVLTFEELLQWFARAQVDLAQCEESRFDEEPAGAARTFPLVGGSLRTGDLTTDLLATEILSVSGHDALVEALDQASPDPGVRVLEPLFCRDGCINGPALGRRSSAIQRRQGVLRYVESAPGQTPAAPGQVGVPVRVYGPLLPPDPPVDEEQIREVLEKTGKADPAHQLNCGACGYACCRDKAIAVVRGMAEPEMCIPFMRRLAEQRTDRIIETSPNGIVIVDAQLRIMHMNPAFRKFFMCSDAVLGKPISYLMDADRFDDLVAGRQELVSAVVTHSAYGLIAHQLLYALPEERQYVGIFVNITGSRATREKLTQLRAQTLAQARELLDHQVQMAQSLTKFLGESTARSEALLEKLMLQVDDQAPERAVDEETRSWQSTYTSR